MKGLLKKQFIFSLMITALSINLAAESFRVSKVHIASINQDTNFETTVKLGINDGLGIELPADQTFIEGLELKMDIPESVAYWMDSVACSVYANVNPNPKSSQIDYSGTRAYVSTLPGKLSWVLQIPIKKENSIKSNKYTTKVDSVVQPKNNFIFITNNDGSRENGFSFKGMAEYMVSLGCQTGFNLDGGGSTTLLVKNKGASPNTLVGNKRKVADILYFHE